MAEPCDHQQVLGLEAALQLLPLLPPPWALARHLLPLPLLLPPAACPALLPHAGVYPVPALGAGPCLAALHTCAPE